MTSAGVRRSSDSGRAADRRIAAGLGLAWLAFLAGAAALVVGERSLPPPSPDLVALAVSAGALCLAALTVRREPVVAWPSLVLAGIAATGIPVRAGADRLAPRGAPYPFAAPPEDWLPLALLVAASASATVVVAALYATRPDRDPGRACGVTAWALTAWTLIAASAAIGLRLIGGRSDPALTLLDVVLLPVSGWLVIVLGVAAVGVAADVRPAIARARARIATGEVGPGPAARVAVVVDELLGRGAGRQAAAEAERHRLAGDLHAEVMPALRHALTALEAGRPPAEVAAELRTVADDLEGVVAARRDPVLELLGLVRALEILAERVEERGGPTIEIVIPDGVSDATGPGRPPLHVEAAALRVAMLALDNTARHATASHVEIACAARTDRLDLTIADDGRGLDRPVEVVATAGRHGLADMRRAAVEAGGAVDLGARPGGGTLVRFRWPA